MKGARSGLLTLRLQSGLISRCIKSPNMSSTLDDEALQAAIEEESSQTCGEFARQFNTFIEMVRLHLHHLGKTYRLSKRVPHTLLEVHKQQRVAACLSLLSCHHSASIFNRVLTSDKKWVLYETPRRSRHWLPPQDAVLHSERPSMHPRKIMLCVWWTCRQVKEPALVNRKGALLLYDNVKRYVTRVARNTIQEYDGWETLCHPPYSPDLVSSGYHLFRSLDNHLHGESFTNEADVRQALTDFFASHTPEFYRKGIKQLETRWQKMLDADDDYFEE
ncbi:histone-lysine N-methyltransferase SETMAR [Trichonephila inaurata madagascariensis]|uniref:Histone-lysine N-methyltransferase SETMAR n=1 Tax=Trichonephila inaurata madagascariensis TaxID=2747483 RepID=A0A8X6XHI0_9ARAC|nr:histone-lysine N-methyltransferase SETMAR [Trichonephila inaurata madagascariensis]